jgi:hypothetical protein
MPGLHRDLVLEEAPEPCLGRAVLEDQRLSQPSSTPARMAVPHPVRT